MIKYMFFWLFFCLTSLCQSQTKGLIISEIFTNPSGNDSPFEYVELLATRNINFSMTPYTVVFADNGSATNSGWAEGGNTTYAFQINSGIVSKGQIVYVGGTNMSPLLNNGIAIRKINNSILNGDGFGISNTNGTLGNGGNHADGLAIFNGLTISITSSSVPVDALFFGSTVGDAFKGSTKGYQLPINDKYNGGKLLNNSFVAPDPSSGELIKAVSGIFKPSINAFTTSRTWIKTTSPTFNTTSITMLSGINLSPLINLKTPTISISFTNSVNLSADAIDPDGNISNVKFYNGSTLLSTIITAPFNYTWTNITSGTYTIIAKTTDNNGATATSVQRIITIPPATNLAPTINFNTTVSKYVDLTSDRISCVRNNSTDPFIISGLDLKVNDENLNSLNFSMTSSNTSVLSSTNFTISGSGINRKFKINPSGVGYTIITLKVKDTKGLSNDVSLKLAVSNALSSASTKQVYHTGVGDGSTAIPVDNNYMFVGNDESNSISLYSRNNSGLPIYKFDLSPYLNLSGTEIDIEASYRSTTIPNRIYWIGSMSNSKTGVIMPDRNRLFATDIIGTGVNSQLQFVGYYDNLRNDLISWGDSKGYNFTSKAAQGIEPKRIDGFNIEGLEMGPDQTTLYIGFRAPYVGSNNDKALICPLKNFETWFNNGKPSQKPLFGNGIELKLNNHGIRSIGKNSQNEFLIVAGSYDTFGTFELYKWNGNAVSTPSILTVNFMNLKPEAIISIPSPLTASFVLDVISDFGTNVWYNDAVENKDLPYVNYKKFLSSTLNVSAPFSLSMKLNEIASIENIEAEISNESKLEFYPNPTDGRLKLNFNTKPLINEFIIFYNSYGIVVKTISLNTNEKSFEIDINDFEKGLYFVQYSATPKQILKVIKD